MSGAPHRPSALHPPLAKRDAAAAAVLLALIVVMFWPLATMRCVPIPNDVFTSDLHYAHLPFRLLMADSLRAGHLPFWTPLVYAGYPLLADSATGTFFPLNWLFIWLPWPLALNLDLLLTFWLAALFMYLYGRTLGLARGACLAAAVAFTLSGLFIGHVRHPNLINALIWVPAMLALVEVALRTGRRSYWLWLAVAFALQIFAGGLPVVYVTVLGLGAYVIARAIMLRASAALPWRAAVAPVAWAAGALALGGALAAVQALPMMELAGQSERATGLSLETAEYGSLPPKDLLMFLYPYWNGDPGRGTYAGTLFWENCGYLGLLPLVMALVAIVWLWRRRRSVRLLALGVAAAAIITLGPATPAFYLARKVVPGFVAFRFPQRFILWVILGLCLLAAIGLTELAKRLAPRWARLVLVVALAVTFFDLFALQRRRVPVVPVAAWTQAPESVAALRRQQATRIYTLAAAESFMTAYWQAHGWQGDLAPYVRQRALLQPNSNALYRFASPAGYADLTPGLSAQVWGSSLQPGLARTLMVRGLGREIAVQPALQRLLDAWSVGHVLSLVPLRAAGLWQTERAGWALLHVNPTALPRVRICPRARVLTDDEAMRLLAEGQWNPAETVLLAPGPRQVRPLAPGGVGRARITADHPTHITVRTRCSAPAWLLLADTWYPGWRARLDDKPVPIHRANLCQRALPIPAGRHTVTFRYHPAAYQRGLIISLLALALWLAAMGFTLPRPRA